MKPRLSIKELEPEAYRIMYQFERYLRHSDIDKDLLELLKIRASQINGCAFCIQMHARDARKRDIPEHKIYVLSAWRDSSLFSDREKAVLAMTEEITNIADAGLTEATFQRVKQYYDDNTIAQLIIAINTINAWNRIGMATHLEFHVED